MRVIAFGSPYWGPYDFKLLTRVLGGLGFKVLAETRESRCKKGSGLGFRGVRV